MTTLYLRPSRLRILFWGSVGLGVSSFALYLEVSASTSTTTLILLAFILVSVLSGIANYLWFHYVAVDQEGIQQVQFFSLVRRLITVSDITEVSSGSVRPTLFAYATIRIRSQEREIEFIPELYERSAVHEAMRTLQAAGIRTEVSPPSRSQPPPRHRTRPRPRH
jgi:hypothetical protein